MNNPKSPYKYDVCFIERERLLVLHHVIESDGSNQMWTACGYPQSLNYWFRLWITQEQLDAVDSQRWCQGCLREIG